MDEKSIFIKWRKICMEREKLLSFDFSKNMDAYEGFDSFMHRIFSFQRADFTFGVEKFEPSNSVQTKVLDNKKFSKFIGDTVTFGLDNKMKKFIFDWYIKPLYQVAPQCFAEKLKEHTLHMTLHDLNATSTEDADVLMNMFETEVLMTSLIDKLKTKPQTVNMVTTCTFNMVNTSVVLGLRPKDEEDYEKLMHFYCHIERIHKLPYLLTPHITLAYFNRDTFEGEALREIERVMNYLNRASFEIPLSTERLYYQKFVSMNDYFDILPFVR